LHGPWWIGYLVTLALEATLTAGLLELAPHFPLARFPIAYVLLIMFVAYVFGEGPAMLAFISGLFAFDYYFVAPVGTSLPHLESPEGWAALAAFMIGTLIVGFATILMRRSRQRTEQMARSLQESESDLNKAQAVAHVGSWRLDVRRNELLWSDEVYRIFGIALGTPLTYEAFLAAVHPEDRDFVDASWQVALTGKPYDIEHRIVTRDGVKWVRERAELEFDAQGALLGGFGTVQDITERKEAENRERELEEHKLEFYQRTLQAATGGKLVVTDRERIERIAGPALATWEIKDVRDLSRIRSDAADAAGNSCMDESRIGKFQVCVGEATTNAIKHAEWAIASLHSKPDSLIFVVADNGPGIEAATMPDVALTPGFSTVGTLGMGYKVILSFADKVYLATSSDGTILAFEMKLLIPEPPLPPGLALSAVGSATDRHGHR
jgi:PAS domain S-box-containing protein